MNSAVASAPGAVAVTDAQFNALSGRVDGLEGAIGTLFDLSSTQRKETRQGIAAAMALADAPMPSAPGKTSYIGKGAVYRGELAFSLGITHRLDTDSPFAISASVSHAGGKDTGASVAFSGEF